MSRISRYGFIYFLTIIFAVTLLTIPVFAKDKGNRSQAIIALSSGFYFSL